MADELDAELARFHAEPIEITRRAFLPDLDEGLTTIYDAAMALFGREPRNSELIDDYTTAGRLEDFIKSIPGVWSLFCDLRARLNDGRLTAIVAEYLPNGYTLDPFRTLISYADAKAVFDARQRPLSPGGAAASNLQAVNTPTAKNTRPIPSDGQIEAWLRDRLTKWPEDKTAPTAAATWEAAHTHFGDGLPRRLFRPICEKVLPPEWRKSGRRKPWGQVKAAIAKSAEKAAKLPRQK